MAKDECTRDGGPSYQEVGSLWIHPQSYWAERNCEKLMPGWH